MIFFLISHILSISCEYSVDVETKPMRYSFNVDEGEHICINSTHSFLTVVFHNSILNVKYYTEGRYSDLIESGNFLFPSENGGISFSVKRGSLDVTTLLPGNVSFSVFAFPSSCLGRIVTTKPSNEIILKDKFGSFQKGYYCIWYPQSKYTIAASEAPESPDSLSICESSSECEEPLTNDHLSETISNPSFIKINAHTIDVYKHFQFDLSSKTKNRIIPFDMSAFMNITETSLFEITPPKKIKKEESKEDVKDDKNDDKNEDRNDNADDGKKDEDDEQEKDKDANENYNRKNPIEIPPIHDGRRSSRKEISFGEIVAMITVICAIVITFVFCFLCGGSNSVCKRLRMHQGRQRLIEEEHKQSETRLLGNEQNQRPVMVAMMPVYSNSNQQMPLTGVYFPPVTSEEAANIPPVSGQNNQQPQPLLLLPAPQNSNQQNQQPGMQPQLIYPQQQQYYPQYAFVQAPQGYGNQQPQNPTTPETNAPANQ